MGVLGETVKSCRLKVEKSQKHSAKAQRLEARGKARKAKDLTQRSRDAKDAKKKQTFRRLLAPDKQSVSDYIA
jgi:hypothetical protein